ncbi:MAG: GRP family sugar transporter, partial [Lactobacillaceae bacterium]|nr:GRP family sugar transporter [Lactobacillaceae bacterium]
DSRIWVTGLLSGLLWAVGQAAQFVGFKKLGVSVGNPISTAGQVIGNALLAAAVLGEWTNAKMWIFGILAILAVTIGAIMTALPDKNAQADTNPERNFPSGLVAMLISTVGYMGYFIVPNLLSKFKYIPATMKEQNNGVDYMTAIIAPQSLGQIIGAFVVVIFFMKEANIMFQKATWKNIVTGLVWALGNVFMFISAANPSIGQATASTLSQTGSVVAVLGGVYILGEKKTRRQMTFALIGVVFVVVGAIMISNLAKL